MSVVIKAEGLGKSYRLRHEQQQPYATLRETASAKVKSLFSTSSVVNSYEEFWALRDLNFEINEGDRVGIIGRNGAGKSTLLKILSRITEPTTGKVALKGRVASLLEVGTGFHPELTGRENIFLNGSILGMNKAEIKKKFDEIVAFAEIEKFLDTPVKRYSSGMYVRLAFAVAAHLEPEILIVDEVLAVGDAQFQKKCMGKMQDVSGQGRTILFVSHNMGAVNSLCTKSIVLHKGQIQFTGSESQGVSFYLKQSEQSGLVPLHQRTDRKGNARFKFNAVIFHDKENNPVSEILSGSSLKLNMEFSAQPDFDFSQLLVSVSFYDDADNIALAFISDEMGVNFSFLKNKNSFTLYIPEFRLRGNNYRIKLFASCGGTATDNVCDAIDNVSVLRVLPADMWNSGIINREGNYPIFNASFSHD